MQPIASPTLVSALTARRRRSASGYRRRAVHRRRCRAGLHARPEDCWNRQDGGTKSLWVTSRGLVASGRDLGSMVGAMLPSLKTERLVLRPLRADDLDSLAVLHEEHSFWQYPLGRGQTRDETMGFLQRVLDSYEERGFGLAAVVDGASGDLAGWAGLSVPSFLPEVLPAVEVGWRLGSAWRGRGYATEAGAAWVEWGFERLGLDRLVSIFEPANAASGRVMEKLGFELDRVTVHPKLGMDLHVTALDQTRWARIGSSVTR